MIVVSNTSPLTNLAAIDRFDLLRQLYFTLHIAGGVWAELNSNGIAWPGSQEVQAAGWIIHHAVKRQMALTELRARLDRGEAESIILALQLKADLMCYCELWISNPMLSVFCTIHTDSGVWWIRRYAP